MPRFSQTSREKLNTCHRDLQVLFNYVVIDYDCTITCGFRNEEDQNAAFVNHFSQLQWPNSKHNSSPSKAVDVVPYEKSGVDYKKTQSAHFAGYVLGIANMLFMEGLMAHKIRCGVDWNSDNDIDDTKFWDGCHFEIIDKPII